MINVRRECLKVSQMSRALHHRSWLGTNARARVIKLLKLLVAELFAFAAGCDFDCALRCGHSTTGKILLLPLSKSRDVVYVVVVDKTARAGLIQYATGARETGLWTMEVVAAQRLEDMRPPAKVYKAVGISGSSARRAWDKVATLEARSPAKQVAQARGAIVLHRPAGAAVAVVPTQVAPGSKQNRNRRKRAVVRLASGALGSGEERSAARLWCMFRGSSFRKQLEQPCGTTHVKETSY